MHNLHYHQKIWLPLAVVKLSRNANTDGMFNRLVTVFA